MPTPGLFATVLSTIRAPADQLTTIPSPPLGRASVPVGSRPITFRAISSPRSGRGVAKPAVRRSIAVLALPAITLSRMRSPSWLRLRRPGWSWKARVLPAADPSGATPNQLRSIVRSRASVNTPSRATRLFVTPVPGPVNDSPRIVTPNPRPTASPSPSIWTCSLNGRTLQSAPGCVQPSIVVSSLPIIGSADAGAIRWGPGPGIANAIVLPGPAFASVIACRSEPAPASAVVVTVNVAAAAVAACASDATATRASGISRAIAADVRLGCCAMPDARFGVAPGDA